MAAGDATDSLKGDLYEGWLDALDGSILDENFELPFDERVKVARTQRLNKSIAISSPGI